MRDHPNQLDLFDNFAVLKAGFKIHAYRDKPGTGPEDEVCNTCVNFNRIQHHGKTNFKCGLMPFTRGAATDISMSSPACRYWDEISDP